MREPDGSDFADEFHDATQHWAIDTSRHGLILGLMFRALLLALPLLAASCTAEIPNFDDDPRPEVCGGSVCFAPDYLSVRRWGDGELTVAAWRGGDRCELPRSGKDAIPGNALIVHLVKPRPGARLPVINHELEEQVPNDQSEGHATVHALRVDPETGRALADEEAVVGEVTVLDLDSATGRLRIRIRARFSSGVSNEQVLDVAGFRGCSS